MLPCISINEAMASLACSCYTLWLWLRRQVLLSFLLLIHVWCAYKLAKILSERLEIGVSVTTQYENYINILEDILNTFKMLPLNLETIYRKWSLFFLPKKMKSLYNCFLFCFIVFVSQIYSVEISSSIQNRMKSFVYHVCMYPVREGLFLTSNFNFNIFFLTN